MNFRIDLLLCAVVAIFLCACDSGSHPSSKGNGNIDIVVTDSLLPNDDLKLSFGTITVDASAEGAVTVSNKGDADLILGTVGDVLSLASPFVIAVDHCSDKTVVPQASCDIIVQFDPKSAGLVTDSFNIPYVGQDKDGIIVEVTGTGVPVPLPVIVVTDSSSPNDDLQLSFGNITVGTSVGGTVTVSNKGDTDLILGTVGDVLSPAPPFAITVDYCTGQTIAPQGDCSIIVQFNPVSAGMAADSFNIPYQGQDKNGIVVDVVGIGETAPVPDIVVTDTSAPDNNHHIGFGTVIAGKQVEGTVTITNNGTGNLVMGGIADTNALASPFSIVTNTCTSAELTPGTNCHLVIQYHPVAVANDSDSFNISSNDPDSPNITFNVTGTSLPQNIYVSATQTGQGDGSKSNPYASIQEGIGQAVAGQTILVLRGRYLENVVMKTGVDVVGENAGNTYIVGEALVTGIVQFPSGVTDAKISHFTITVGTPVAGYDRGVYFAGANTNAVVERNIITNVQYGIFVYNSSNIRIENNTFQANLDEQGIIFVSGTANGTIRNNIISGYNWGIHQQANTTGGPTVLYNDLFNNNENYHGLTDQTGSNGNISSDPLLDSNLVPPVDSPVVDAGDPASPNDPDGTRSDMGVFYAPQI